MACCSGKTDHPCRASDLYISPLFKKSRKWAEAQPDSQWFILSAKHGLGGYQAVLEPYDDTLVGKSKKDKMLWSFEVWKRLRPLIPRGGEVVWLAGKEYSRYLGVVLQKDGVQQSDLLQNLSIGRRLQLLNTLI